MSRKPTAVADTAGAQMWAGEVAALVGEARAVARRAEGNLQYHRDRVRDDDRAREAMLEAYANINKIEANCFGGRRMIPRGNDNGQTTSPPDAAHYALQRPATYGEAGETTTMMAAGVSGGGSGHTPHCGAHCRREHHLPDLPLIARGVQAAKYRLRERAERRRRKEERALLAREAEKHLRRERLRAAKELFSDDGGRGHRRGGGGTSPSPHTAGGSSPRSPRSHTPTGGGGHMLLSGGAASHTSLNIGAAASAPSSPRTVVGGGGLYGGSASSARQPPHNPSETGAPQRLTAFLNPDGTPRGAARQAKISQLASTFDITGGETVAAVAEHQQRQQQQWGAIAFGGGTGAAGSARAPSTSITTATSAIPKPPATSSIGASSTHQQPNSPRAQQSQSTSASAPASPNNNSNNNNNRHQQQQQQTITAALLATSGLPPDMLKAGAAAVTNMAAATRLLLLTRAQLTEALETTVEPARRALADCFATRQAHIPPSESGFHDGVEKAFLAAIAAAEGHQRSLEAQRVGVEDVVAYCEGLRKAIAGRLPRALRLTVGDGDNKPQHSSVSDNDFETTNDGTAAVTTLGGRGGDSHHQHQHLINDIARLAPLPQVRAAQQQPAAVLNLVALATGKRRRVPLNDTQAAITAAGHAHAEAVATNDAAQSARRAVIRDTRAQLEGVAAALSGKIRDNKGLQRALTAEVAALEEKLRGLDDFLAKSGPTTAASNSAHSPLLQSFSSPTAAKSPRAVTFAPSQPPPAAAATANDASDTADGPSTTTAKGASQKSNKNQAHPPTTVAPIVGGAGVVVPPVERAAGHVAADRAAAAALLAQMRANAAAKRALEVVDVEVLRTIEGLLEGRRKGGALANAAAVGGGTSKPSVVVPRPPPLRRQAAEHEPSSPLRPPQSQHSQPYMYPFAAGLFSAPTPALPSSGRGGAHNHQHTYDQSSSGRSAAASSSPRKQQQNAAGIVGGAHASSSDVDDLLSGRATVSTRSAKVAHRPAQPFSEAAAPPLSPFCPAAAAAAAGNQFGFFPRGPCAAPAPLPPADPLSRPACAGVK